MGARSSKCRSDTELNSFPARKTNVVLSPRKVAVSEEEGARRFGGGSRILGKPRGPVQVGSKGKRSPHRSTSALSWNLEGIDMDCPHSRSSYGAHVNNPRPAGGRLRIGGNREVSGADIDRDRTSGTPWLKARRPGGPLGRSPQRVKEGRPWSRGARGPPRSSPVRRVRPRYSCPGSRGPGSHLRRLAQHPVRGARRRARFRGPADELKVGRSSRFDDSRPPTLSVEREKRRRGQETAHPRGARDDVSHRGTSSPPEGPGDPRPEARRGGEADGSPRREAARARPPEGHARGAPPGRRRKVSLRRGKRPAEGAPPPRITRRGAPPSGRNPFQPSEGLGPRSHLPRRIGPRFRRPQPRESGKGEKSREALARIRAGAVAPRPGPSRPDRWPHDILERRELVAGRSPSSAGELGRMIIRFPMGWLDPRTGGGEIVFRPPGRARLAREASNQSPGVGARSPGVGRQSWS